LPVALSATGRRRRGSSLVSSGALGCRTTAASRDELLSCFRLAEAASLCRSWRPGAQERFVLIGGGSARFTSSLAGARHRRLADSLSTWGDRRSPADVCGFATAKRAGAKGKSRMRAVSTRSNMLRIAASPNPGRPADACTQKSGDRSTARHTASQKWARQVAASNRRAEKEGGAGRREGSRAGPSAPLLHRFAGSPPSVLRDRVSAGLHRAQGGRRRHSPAWPSQRLRQIGQSVRVRECKREGSRAG